jgi:hypothetical protein
MKCGLAADVHDVQQYLAQKWDELESRWSNIGGTDAKDETIHSRLEILTGGGTEDKESFAKWLALSLHSGHLREKLGVPSWVHAKDLCNRAFTALKPKTRFMRLTVGQDGRCKDIPSIPTVTLTEKGIKPWRRNGPIDVTGVYGRDDCVLVALNGAFGAVHLTRADLAAFQPLFTTGGLSLKDKQLREVVDRSPFRVEYRKKLSNSYEVFLKTSGIYVACAKLICADGSEQYHAIYIDCERDVVHFGYNDAGTDMISFFIEKPDRRDVASAEANLVTPANFPHDTNNPGRSLEKIEILDVVQVMLKVKAIAKVSHASYVYQPPTTCVKRTRYDRKQAGAQRMQWDVQEAKGPKRQRCE